MKYLVTLHNKDNLTNLLHADGYIIGNSLFSVRLTNSFEPIEINEIIKFANDNKKDIFLSLNKMFYDEDFLKLDNFLNLINIKDLTGIIASDLGLVHFLIEKGLNNKIIWEGESLTTNQFDFNFLHEFNILGSFVAKEITIEDIIDIGKNKKHKLFLTGHGYFSMFYSKRKLISNFSEHYNLNLSCDNNKYHLEELARVGEKYPILEDNDGTHVFRSRVTNSFNVLNELEEVVDYFVINSLFKDDLYTIKVLSLYQNGYNKTILNDIKEKYNETWDDGFYTTKTVYLKENLWLNY